MNDQDRVVHEALASADRITRYRLLRMVVVVAMIVIVAIAAVDAYRVTRLNDKLCERSAGTRQAVRDLALATLITTPIPANVDAATRPQILQTRKDRREAVDRFLAKYPRVSC